ncbi:MAG: response regulator [Bernardetiaceae bacterium]|nr:response regulator [Bernardetiaceae bacterium]
MSYIQEKKMQVLVVEDDFINALIFRKFLEKNFEITEAKNGIEALAAVQKTHFDVILLDINLGEDVMDGVEVMRRIRLHYENKKKTPKLIAVTSYALPAEEEKFLRAGFDAYYIKPIDQQDLINAINSFRNQN